MEPSQVSVVMVPLPMQSHLNQLLELSALIASRGLPVHFVGSTTHNRQAKLRSHGVHLGQIQFHDLPTGPIDAPEPNQINENRAPTHLWPALAAYYGLRQHVTSLVHDISLQSRRVVIIYDRTVAEIVLDAVSLPKTESYGFNCLSAFNLFSILWEARGKPFEIPGELMRVPPIKEFLPEDGMRFIVNINVPERAGDIHNTNIVIDKAYIDLMGREEISGNKKQWAIRPTLHALQTSSGGTQSRHDCLDWLAKQAPRSVIYVSFGTSALFTEQEVKEMAMGLEQSGKKFIWVLREADKANIFAPKEKRIELPEGFEERVKENGVVIREWAPQLEILGHKSIGGFLSHCGWNSCFESLMVGVPIAALPIHSDQPLNALHVTEVLKAGLMVREWKERMEDLKAEVFKDAVERLIGSEEGDELRKRAGEVSEAIKESMEEGGASYKEVNEFIAHITRSS